MPHVAIDDFDAKLLRKAANYLDNPSLLMRLADAVGRPLEGLAGLAGSLVPARVGNAANAALRQTMLLAVGTIRSGDVTERRLKEAYEASGWTGMWHTLATVGTGFVGGFFGLPALALELPITTGILFRSIAVIAGDNGENLQDPAVRMECLSVFSHGGAGRGGEALESSYLTTRVAMATLVEDAARFVARESAEAVADALARGAAPPCSTSSPAWRCASTWRCRRSSWRRACPSSGQSAARPSTLPSPTTSTPSLAITSASARWGGDSAPTPSRPCTGRKWPALRGRACRTVPASSRALALGVCRRAVTANTAAGSGIFLGPCGFDLALYCVRRRPWTAAGRGQSADAVK